jgi:hypothetical protein
VTRLTAFTTKLTKRTKNGSHIEQLFVLLSGMSFKVALGVLGG